VVNDAIEGVGHVHVTDVPGFRATSHRRAVVALGARDDGGVLFGDEAPVLVGG
jgi:hypothetical protein